MVLKITWYSNDDLLLSGRLAEAATECEISLSAASFIEDFLTEVFGQHCSSQSDDRDLDITGWVLIYEVRVRTLQASLSSLKGLPSM